MEAAKQYKGEDPVTDKVLETWEYVLDRLEENFMDLTRDLDWVIKLRLLGDCARDRKWTWGGNELVDVNIRYHEIDRERGLFYRLQAEGEINRLVRDEEIEHAVDNPPEDTRAWLRGGLIKATKGGEYGWDFCDNTVNGFASPVVMIDPNRFTKGTTPEDLIGIGREDILRKLNELHLFD